RGSRQDGGPVLAQEIKDQPEAGIRIRDAQGGPKTNPRAGVRGGRELLEHTAHPSLKPAQLHAAFPLQATLLDEGYSNAATYPARRYTAGHSGFEIQVHLSPRGGGGDNGENEPAHVSPE